MIEDSVSFAESRAVLVGVASYVYEDYPVVPAAANSLHAMHALLTDKSLCGWPEDRVTVIEDPDDAVQLTRTLRRIAEATNDVLLFYFVGHGTMTARGELCLAVTDTEASDADITGVEYSRFKDILVNSPARTKVVILDCCYAGRAIESLVGETSVIADSTAVRRAYTLTASDHAAHVVSLDQQDTACTSFTAELVDLVREGVEDGPPTLTLNFLYSLLLRRLVAADLPRPNQRGTDTADRFPFTRNLAVSGQAVRHFDRELGSLSLQRNRRTPAPQSTRRASTAPRSRPTQEATWPDPRKIRTTRDYFQTLARTWIRAGAPNGDEIERRTGGAVRSFSLNPLVDYSKFYRYDTDNFDDSLMVLEACGVPERLMLQWKDASVRAQRSVRHMERHEDLAVHNSRWPIRLAWAYVLLPALTGALGLATSQWGAANPPLAGGDVVAIALTYIAVLSGAAAAGVIATVYTAMFFRLALPALCIAAFFVCWLKVGTIPSVHHLAMDLRNWASWKS